MGFLYIVYIKQAHIFVLSIDDKKIKWNKVMIDACNNMIKSY